MLGLLPFALLSFSALFVIVDPIGVVPIFITLTPADSPARRQEMARRACLVAWALLLGFALGGTFVFRLIGVSLAAFKVAGGLLLLLTAGDQLRAVPARTRTTAEEQHAGTRKDDISVTPLAIPLLAGPGSMATTVMLMSRAHSLAQRGTVLTAITAVIALAYAALGASERISRLLGTMGRQIVERLGGLVLAAIAVQFVLDGALEVVRK